MHYHDHLYDIKQFADIGEECRAEIWAASQGGKGKWKGKSSGQIFVLVNISFWFPRWLSANFWMQNLCAWYSGATCKSQGSQNSLSSTEALQQRRLWRVWTRHSRARGSHETKYARLRCAWIFLIRYEGRVETHSETATQKSSGTRLLPKKWNPQVWLLGQVSLWKWISLCQKLNVVDNDLWLLRRHKIQGVKCRVYVPVFL